ncbi:lysophospholipase [Tricladium varicosporioides]|nr:lysophospholipase [Hymenoscyphus varicosporioides]
MITTLLASLFATTAVAANAYAPVTGTCPSGSLVRPANGLSDSEEAYRVARKAVADVALKAWLKKTNSGFGTSNLPTIALTTSGGGYRSMLSGAGVIQGLDGRDSSVSTSGLYQALTYQAGLSGGGWMLSSLAGNNYPTISYLRDELWKEAIRDSLLDPSFLLAAVAYAGITSDILAKEAAGFDTTIIDPYGRLLGYQLFEGSWGGVTNTLSGVTAYSNFTSHTVPYPIITALGAKVWLGECTPGPNGTTYEFSPYEFGSWDADLSAFVQTKYLGTNMKSGVPVSSSKCVTNYDNLGFIAGTSSDIFSTLCINAPDPVNDTGSLADTLAAIVDNAHEITTSDEYALYPNPFYQYRSSTQIPNSANNITAQKTLSLVDGGQALQNNPIFPFLQPARNVSVILVNDNSADTSDNWPNGTEILTTYVQSFNHGLSLMPFIPPVAKFLSLGLNKRATFFGCDDSSKITIVYLPNNNYTFASDTATSKLVYSEDDTEAMIANGVEIATQGGDSSWGTCLGCAVMMKTGSSLPAACTACFAKYCYYGDY